MGHKFNKMPDSKTWAILVGAAKTALEDRGYQMERRPGRGRSNVWQLERAGKKSLASIRTTKDRWIAFPPLAKGQRWKTLDDVDVVVVAAVNDVDDPSAIEVYEFDSKEVRKRFDDAYSARTKAGLAVKDNYGMWVGLDVDTRGGPKSVGSGLSAEYSPIATYAPEDLLESETALADEDASDRNASTAIPSTPEPRSIADVMKWARERIASLSGAAIESVRLDLRIESNDV